VGKSGSGLSLPIARQLQTAEILQRIQRKRLVPPKRRDLCLMDWTQWGFRCDAQRSSLAATADICLERGCLLASRQNRGQRFGQPAYCGLQNREVGRRFSTVPVPGGGLYVAQALKLLERFDLNSLGYNSPEYVRPLAEVMKIATRDKDTRVADPRFIAVPTEELLSTAYVSECEALIRSGTKVDALRSGHLESKHTTHVSCVDRNGMVVSMTHTLGNPSGFVVEDTGILMNGAMSMFDLVRASRIRSPLGRGARPRCARLSYSKAKSR
jgi:hypothetical protein